MSEDAPAPVALRNKAVPSPTKPEQEEVFFRAPTISFSRQAPQPTEGRSMSQPKMAAPKSKAYSNAKAAAETSQRFGSEEKPVRRPSKVLDWFAKSQADRQQEKEIALKNQ